MDSKEQEIKLSRVFHKFTEISNISLSFVLNCLSSSVVMQIDWHWQFGFLLTLPVIGVYSSKHGPDENTEDSLSGNSVQAGMEGEMCQKGDMGNQLGLDGDLGFGWHLVGVEEREGKCPGTREKVGGAIEN